MTTAECDRMAQDVAAGNPMGLEDVAQNATVASR